MGSILFCLQTASFGVEPGSKAPSFELTSLAGASVTFEVPSRESLALLYFFDASEGTVETLRRLNEASLKSPGVMTLLALTRTNPEELKARIGDGELRRRVLVDDAGVTFAYGLSKTVPACVVAGPGGIVACVVAPVRDGGEALTACADVFISMGLPRRALWVCESAPEELLHGAKRSLIVAYASMLDGDTEAARRMFESLADGPPPLSFEAWAGLGFLLYREGRDKSALRACGRAPSNGFANWVAGMAKARLGECDDAAVFFRRASQSDFVFSWQRALAFTMAARTMETRGKVKDALGLHKEAFAAAPLNPVIPANLLSHYWADGNYPAASSYADLLEAHGSAGPLVQALVGEFELERSLARKALRDTAAGRPNSILVSDVLITGCPPELSSLSLAVASLVKQNLEKTGRLVAVPRPVVMEKAERLGVKPEDLQDPLKLKKLAAALSVNLMALGTLGTHEGRYLLNIRIAEVKSERIIAVSSERFQSNDELPRAIKNAVKTLSEKMAAYKGG